jgi:hypothetical protein
MDRKGIFLLLFLLILACSIPTAAPVGTATPVRLPTEAPQQPAPTTTTEPLPRPSEYLVCGGDKMVVLLVDATLLGRIRAGLDTFESDLCLAGYAATERRSDFSSPPEVRSYLADLYHSSGKTLIGAILIGNVPHAYQYIVQTFTNPNIPPLEEEVISFQFYADLDGTFRASPGYVSPGGHTYSYDVHEGDLDWEIWVSALPAYGSDPLRTAGAINGYFEKNHAYRSGAHDIPPAFLEISELLRPRNASDDAFFLDGMASGEYAWTPFSNSPAAHLYIDSYSGAVTTDQGYANLAAGVADIAVLDAHGYYLASGRIDANWVERNGIRAVLLWSNGCAVGNLDYPDNFLTNALYSPRSRVLIAKGTTNDSGGMGTNRTGFFGHNIASSLSRGMSLGEAVLSHVNTPLIAPWSDSREFHYATAILLGDPTLRLRP